MHLKGGGAIQKTTEPGESGSCRDRERPRETAVPGSKIDCADDPPGRPGPRGPIAAVVAQLLRDLVHGRGLIGLRHVFQRQSGLVKLLVNSVQVFLVLGRVGCGGLDVAARILFRSSQARSQRFYLGDERFTNAPILDFVELPFGF